MMAITIANTHSPGNELLIHDLDESQHGMSKAGLFLNQHTCKQCWSQCRAIGAEPYMLTTGEAAMMLEIKKRPGGEC